MRSLWDPRGSSRTRRLVKLERGIGVLRIGELESLRSFDLAFEGLAKLPIDPLISVTFNVKAPDLQQRRPRNSPIRLSGCL